MMEVVKPTTAALRHFCAPTVAWFQNSFASATPVQTATWEALAGGSGDALVIAPTGSGKTLAAFLSSIDELATTPATGKVRVLYVSPLKALAVDIENNLRRPLAGIKEAAARLGLPRPRLEVAVRTGDTNASARRRLISHPPDILITTPESLFLMLSSSAATTLDDVETVIVDEIHSLAGTKRGSHLAVSLARLDQLRADAKHPGLMRRIGLSATVRPPDVVAQFLTGPSRQAVIINPAMPKQWQLDLRVPVEDMANIGAPPGPQADEPAAPNRSIWPHIEEAVLDLVLSHRATICFVNSRMVAERLTAHLNQRAAARLGRLRAPDEAMPSNYTGTHMVLDNPVDDDAAVARAHHGSLSKERRSVIEEDLRAGRLRCVVATSSLELGIDMGFVDLVVQVGSPGSVASGLQRVGRAGHQVGVASKGTVFPTSRADLLEASVVVRGMTEGQIEPITTVTNPLDVLAQQIVSMCLDAKPTATAAYNLVRTTAPFATLPRAAFDSVLDMLTGRYPSEDFAQLRPRLTWDKACDELRARPGSRQLVTTSGGTIPDRGLFGVFLAGPGAGRRVGELDEEMVHESRVGDVITLGSSSWRIDSITPHQVQVSPAPGLPGRLPFWHGEQVSRPFELGCAIGTFIADTDKAAPGIAAASLKADGLDDAATANLTRYIAEQKRATGALPTNRCVVVERFRDELGDWRVCVHAPFGLAVLRPWMLAIRQRLIDRYGVDARVIVHNDGVIWRLPATDADPPSAELLVCSPSQLDEAVRAELFGSPLFAARFRECAARALLLPRRNPGARTPLWQQRLRAAQLLEVATSYQSFPIVMEAMRECLDDVFDMPGLHTLMGGIESGKTQLVDVETATPSPFARSLMFGYAGEFIYDADQPLAERASAALAVDPALLSELLGHATVQACDPVALAEVEARLQRLRHRITSPEALWDMLRTIGPLTTAECEARSDGDATDWLDALANSRRIAAVPLGANLPPGWAVTDDVAQLVAAAKADETARQRLAVRWLGCHVATTAGELTTRYGWAQAQAVLDNLVNAGRAQRGTFDSARPAPQYALPEVIAQVTRRRAAALRAAVKPVDGPHLAGFLGAWHGIVEPQRDALFTAVEQLAGWPVPASMLETLVLPARVANYRPAMLDEALASGQVVWSGAGPIGSADGQVVLWPGDAVLIEPDTGWLADDPLAAQIWERLGAGGAWRVSDLGADSTASQAALWRLAWAGLATCETFAPLRDLPGTLRHPRQPRPRPISSWRPSRPLAPAPRWSAVRPSTDNQTARWAQAVSLQAGRHGVLTRAGLLAEPMTPSFTVAYKVMAAMEQRGLLRRGYFVEKAGGAQFALPGVVDELRAAPADVAYLLAAVDPANPYGVTVAWPPVRGGRPARRAGAMVVLRAGKLICYLERGARTLLTFTAATDDDLAVGLRLIGEAVDAGHLDPVSLTRIDESAALTDQPRARLLKALGFAPTPQGFVRRRA